ncbi:MAG: DUF423 domain-containing protein [Gammaproteobacteria bacterium]|jgi:uncharacterized membrane protein YgdD (TMEM256/DUF423 family)|nr:DUF423 domain-containing protein [Gammaproteobacteria bacterium]
MRGANKVFLVAACLLLLTGVQLGALGAHALTDRLSPQKLNSWELAVQYQLVHSLGLIVIVLLSDRLASATLLRWAGFIMLGGIFLFSGSIYASALGLPAFSQIAPFGGVSFMVAWFMVAIAAFRS